MPHSLVNCLNSSLANCGPPSEIHSDGIPYREKSDFKWMITCRLDSFDKRLSQDSASSSRPSVGIELASGRRCLKLPSPMVDLASHASAVVAVFVHICTPGTRHIARLYHKHLCSCWAITVCLGLVSYISRCPSDPRVLAEASLLSCSQAQ